MFQTKQGQTRSLWGREFTVVGEGLAEAEVVAFVSELLELQQHHQSLMELAQRTVIEAEKLALTIKGKAQGEAQTQAADILSQAQARAEEIALLAQETRQSMIAQAREKAEDLALTLREKSQGAAETQAADILSQAQARAEEIALQAQQQAENLALTLKEKALAEAETQAADILSQAQARAEEIALQAQEQAENLALASKEKAQAEAEARAADILSQAQARAEEIAQQTQETRRSIMAQAEREAKAITQRIYSRLMEVAQEEVGNETSRVADAAPTVAMPEAGDPLTQKIEEALVNWQATPFNQDAEPDSEVDATPAPESVPEMPRANGQELIEGEVDLLLAPPIDLAQITSFQRRLRKQSHMRLIQTVGSWNQGLALTVLVRQPLALAEALQEMPEVEAVQGSKGHESDSGKEQRKRVNISLRCRSRKEAKGSRIQDDLR